MVVAGLRRAIKKSWREITVSRFQRRACATLRSQGFVGEAMGNCWVLLKPDMTRFLFPKDDTKGGVENEFERNKAGSRETFDC